MIEVVLNRSKFKMLPEKALKILKKKMLKEGTLRELRDREFFVSHGRKAYLQRKHAEYVNQFNGEED